MRALWLTAAIAACNSGPTIDPRDVGGKSGSRLLAERWTSSDGTSSFAGWYDSELDTRCEWKRAADGTLRCIPNELYPSYFADSACTRRAYTGGAGCTPKYAGAARVGPRLGRVFGLIENTLCTPVTVELPDHYDVGEPVPPEQFVGGTRKTWGDAIVLDEIHGEDGSIERSLLADIVAPTYESGGYVGGAYVPASDSFCRLRLTGSMAATCSGGVSGFMNGGVQRHYLDDQCTQLAIEQGTFGTTLRYEKDPCGDRPLYQGGSPVDVANVYVRDGNGSCTGLVTRSPVVPLTEVAGASVPLTFAFEPGSKRLRHTLLIAATGETWPGPLFDTATQTPCVPRANAPASARCVPALNEDVLDSAFGGAGETCELSTQMSTAAACWGQTVRARKQTSTACGIAQYELEIAEGRVIDETFYVGLGPQAIWPECTTIDRMGLELREGGYTPTDASTFVEMRLVRDEH